jgi:subtilisin-like proprotein convertase family protein
MAQIRFDRRRRTAARRVGTVLGVVSALFVVLAPVARAGSVTPTFSNPAAIAVPAGSSPDQSGIASPYPSNISVSGLTGPVSDVTATLSGVTHSSADDLDILLVGPTGQRVVLLSDVASGGFASATNDTVVFTDAAATQVALDGSFDIASGVYKPTNRNGGDGDLYPAPAPASPYGSTMASFVGTNPNGTWSLYVVDDSTGDTGTISGGWGLTIATSASAAASTTTVASSVNPSAVGQSVTFTAHVTSGGNPVTSGNVTFTIDGGAGGSGALNGSGDATFSTSGLAEGAHTITATFVGTPTVLTSSGSVTQVVDNATTVNGTTYCNTGAITIPSQGAATPYASHIVVSGFVGSVADVNVELTRFAHSVPVDVDILLVGPLGQNLELLSDVGGNTVVTERTVVLDDEAATGVTGSLPSGSFKPTNDTSDGADTFPAPAPAPSAGTVLSAYDGLNPNGTWSLFVVDDASGDAGSIAGGWCVAITPVTLVQPTVTTQASPGVAVGGQVHDTATLAGGNAPTGTLTFRLFGPNNTSCSGAAVYTETVSVAGNGQYISQSFTTTAPGTYQWKASYSGDANNLPVTGVCKVTSERVVVSAGTPSMSTQASTSVAVGGTITDTATLSGGASPGGGITFRLYGPNNAKCSNVPLYVETVTVLGAGSYTTSPFTPAARGTYRWVASYSGDAANAPVAGACNAANESVVVTGPS